MNSMPEPDHMVTLILDTFSNCAMNDKLEGNALLDLRRFFSSALMAAIVA